MMDDSCAVSAAKSTWANSWYSVTYFLSAASNRSFSALYVPESVRGTTSSKLTSKTSTEFIKCVIVAVLHPPLPFSSLIYLFCNKDFFIYII